MKKLLFWLLITGGGYLLWKRITEDDDAREIWHEVTDSVN